MAFQCIIFNVAIAPFFSLMLNDTHGFSIFFFHKTGIIASTVFVVMYQLAAKICIKYIL